MAYSEEQKAALKVKFLGIFQEVGEIAAAAKRIGKSRTTIFRLIREDGAFKDAIKAERNRIRAEKAFKKAALELEEDKEEQVWRDFQCEGYYLCLRAKALFPSGVEMDCKTCPNRRHVKPTPMDAEEYWHQRWEDDLNCCRLLIAIFNPEAYHNAIREPEEEIDAPLGSVQYL